MNRRSRDMSRSTPAAVITRQKTAPAGTLLLLQQQQGADSERFIPFEYHDSDDGHGGDHDGDGSSDSSSGSGGSSGSGHTERICNLTEQERALRRSLSLQYASPTVQQQRAAVTLQSNVRRYIARKRCEKLRKSNAHRVKVASEILSTEETYVTSLRALRETYLLPMKEEAAKASGARISKAQVSAIFSDIEVIVNVNDHFYQELAKRVEHFCATSTMLSDIFLMIAPFFKSYSRYCNNYDNALAVLKDLRKVDEFKAWIAAMDKASDRTKLGITSYLILPIQRVPRYRLLLEDLIKHTPDHHPDKAGLQEALEKIKDVASHLNVAMKVLEVCDTGG